MLVYSLNGVLWEGLFVIGRKGYTKPKKSFLSSEYGKDMTYGAMYVVLLWKKEDEIELGRLLYDRNGRR